MFEISKKPSAAASDTDSKSQALYNSEQRSLRRASGDSAKSMFAPSLRETSPTAPIADLPELPSRPMGAELRARRHQAYILELPRSRSSSLSSQSPFTPALTVRTSPLSDLGPITPFAVQPKLGASDNVAGGDLGTQEVLLSFSPDDVSPSQTLLSPVLLQSLKNAAQRPAHSPAQSLGPTATNNWSDASDVGPHQAPMAWSVESGSMITPLAPPPWQFKKQPRRPMPAPAADRPQIGAGAEPKLAVAPGPMLGQPGHHRSDEEDAGSETEYFELKQASRLIRQRPYTVRLSELQRSRPAVPPLPPKFQPSSSI